MKALPLLTNVDRAKLIHQMFPGEIRPLIRFSLEMAEKVIAEADQLKETWDNQLIAAGYWIELAKNTKEVIQGNEKLIVKNSNAFADQLFYMHMAFFMGDCVVKYAMFTSDEKFKIAAKLFFEFAGEPKHYAKVVYHSCLSCTAEFLFDAINEAMAQEEKPGINQAAKEHISHIALASLATQIAIQTDRIDNGGYWIDRQGKYIIQFHH